MSGEFVISLVLSCCNNILKWWTEQCYSPQKDSVTAPCYISILFRSKGKYILEAWGNADPKDVKRREASSLILVPLFICFFLLPLVLPYVNWASQEYCSFYLESSLWSSNLPLSYYFLDISLSFLLATAILDFFFLF